MFLLYHFQLNVLLKLKRNREGGGRLNKGIEVIETIGNVSKNQFWLWCNKKSLTPEDIVYILESVKLVEFEQLSRLYLISTDDLKAELLNRTKNGVQ